MNPNIKWNFQIYKEKNSFWVKSIILKWKQQRRLKFLIRLETIKRHFITNQRLKIRENNFFHSNNFSSVLEIMSAANRFIRILQQHIPNLIWQYIEHTTYFFSHCIKYAWEKKNFLIFQEYQQNILRVFLHQDKITCSHWRIGKVWTRKFV